MLKFLYLLCSCRSSNKRKLCFKNILTWFRLTVLNWLIITSYKNYWNKWLTCVLSVVLHTYDVVTCVVVLRRSPLNWMWSVYIIASSVLYESCMTCKSARKRRENSREMWELIFLRQWLWKFLSFEMWPHLALWVDVNVLDEFAATIFRVEEYACA